SSRRRHTRFSRDWSSDVCSSDLGFRPIGEILARQVLPGLRGALRYPLRVSCLGTVRFVDDHDADQVDLTIVLGECASPEDAMTRSEERRVGKEGNYRW